MINIRPHLERIGRRGVCLAFLAEVDTFLFLSLHAPLPYGLRPAQVYAPALRFAPLNAWAAGWLAAAIICAVAVFWFDARPYAFFLASAICTGWGLAYLVAWLGGTLPRGYMSAAVWLTFAGLILVLSGWREGGKR